MIFAVGGVIVLAAAGEWVYSWPYTAAGECRCAERSGTAGFASEAECLTQFAHEKYEFCATEGAGGALVGGISEDQCKDVVSRDPTLTNDDCNSRCMKAVAGLLTYEQLLSTCSIETIVEIAGQAEPLPRGCFSNFVLGYADYNPNNPIQAKPLKSFEDVDSAAKCQYLCQEIDGCSWFQYRAVPDPEHLCGTTGVGLGANGGYQSAPRTCVLYSQNYVDNVMSSDLDAALGGATASCDTQRYEALCSDLLNTSFWTPFRPVNCLACGCEPRCAYKSPAHVSGPAYCQAGLVTDLCSIRPPVPHTTEEITCPETEECITSETTTTTAVDTTESTTELVTTETTTELVTTTATVSTQGGSETTTEGLTTSRTRAPTQPVFTTTPAGGETTTPAGGETTTPAGGETTTPAGGETTTPAGGETTTGLETTSESDTTPAADQSTTPAEQMTTSRHECPDCHCDDDECQCVEGADCLSAERGWEPNDLMH